MHIDHVGLGVADLDASVAFYDRLLGGLGLSRQAVLNAWQGYGDGERALFWIGPAAAPVRPTHVAFAVPSRAEVDRFHTQALAQGAQVHAGPALRPEYHPSFYSAMVLDPDGHNIEVVCHAAEPAQA